MAQSAPIGWKNGCEHYRRSCKIVAPCCNTVFSCRFCHDEKRDHPVDRFKVKHVICNVCAKKQPVSRKCESCKTSFGFYVCLICKLFDDEDRQQFHCSECGICRVGGKQNYFHCRKCNYCIAWRLVNDHHCVENASRVGCPICLEDMHTSRKALFMPQCGHLLHEICYEQVKVEHKACILCQKPYLKA